jgi:hypothetical protein
VLAKEMEGERREGWEWVQWDKARARVRRKSRGAVSCLPCLSLLALLLFKKQKTQKNLKNPKNPQKFSIQNQNRDQFISLSITISYRLGIRFKKTKNKLPN